MRPPRFRINRRSCWPKTVATDELPAITRSTLERSIRVHRTNLLLTAVTGSRRQIPLMSATAAGEEIELEWLGSRLDITPGIFQITQRPLDLAINGAGWFVVTLEDERLYTRDGSFSLDPEGRLGLLTPRGFAPLVPSIVVSDATQRIEVQTNGSVYVTENADVESKVVGQVEVVSFLDDTALRLHASGCYRATAEAGRPTQLLSQGSKGSAVQVRSGMLERTNVNVEAEMLAIERLAAGLKRD
jgi:flagellar basal body rod protein FlgG